MDVEKDMVRTDCADDDMMTSRMIIGLDKILWFNMDTEYIEGDFMKIVPIEKEIYIRPPKEFHRKALLFRII